MVLILCESFPDICVKLSEINHVWIKILWSVSHNNHMAAIQEVLTSQCQLVFTISILHPLRDQLVYPIKRPKGSEFYEGGDWGGRLFKI